MGRGKNKHREQSQVVNIDELEIENKVEIDYDKLALAIVRAKQIEKENEEAAKVKALAEWRVSVGYKEHNDKKGLLKHVFRFFNRAKVVFNIMFISKRKHIATSPTSAFIQGLTSLFFNLCCWGFTLLAIAFAGAMAYHPNLAFAFNEYFTLGSFAVLSFMLSRVFRLMAIEIDQMSNREQVLGVFTAVISVFPLVEKVVELFQGVS
jgi:hypothetical protein